MKQTIKTTNYNAVINIPYEKLAKKSNCIRMDSMQLNNESLAKTIVIPHCHECCQQTSSTSTKQNISIEVLQQLQKAFNEDMQAKNIQIDELRQRFSNQERQLLENKNSLQKLKSGDNFQKDQQIKKINTLQYHIDNLSKQLAMVHQQKERILKIKIIEFKNNQVQAHKNQKDKMEVEIKEREQKKQEEFDQQVVSYIEEINQLQENIKGIKIEYEVNLEKIQEEKQLSNKQLQNYRHIVIGLNQQIEKDRVRQRQYIIVENQKNLLVEQLRRQNQFMRVQLIENSRQTNQNQQIINFLRGKLTSANSANTSPPGNTTTNDNDKIIDQEKQNIDDSHNHNECRAKIQQIEQDKLGLLKKIEQLQQKAQFQEYQNNKREKQNKIYEVKIQKVIDRQDYINSLQNQLQAERRKTLFLSEQIKKMEKMFQQNNKQLQSKLTIISQLEKKIEQLKIYIQEKEKSFSWVVEREIAKDIELNRGETNRTYKVFPMEPKTHKKGKQKQRLVNVQIGQSQKISIDENYESYIVRKLDENQMLREVCQYTGHDNKQYEANQQDQHQKKQIHKFKEQSLHKKKWYQ